MFVSIISVVMMMIDHRQHHLESIRSIFSVIVYPIQYLVDVPSSAGSWVGENLSSRGTLLIENQKLREEQILQRARLLKLSALKVENNRLRELLQSSRKVGENVLIGELLAVDLEPFTKQIVINKGTYDGVFLGQPLLDADGVMGQIVHIGLFTSTAMMITDPSHAIPVQVNRNGLRAILVGTGSPDLMEVPFLANSTDIAVGDLLTSSGLGGKFPPDYPVATVISVKKDPAKPYAVITAKPTAQLERSREVLLVWRTQEGRPKVSAPKTENDGMQQDQASELEAGATHEVPAPANSISLDAIETQIESTRPAPVLSTPNEVQAPQSDVSTGKVTPAPEKPKSSEKVQPLTEKTPPITVESTEPIDDAAEEVPLGEARVTKAKPNSSSKPPSIPLSEQLMPIEENFVAPASPSSQPVDEQEIDEGSDQ